MQLTTYELYQKMFQRMGPQGWWPADSKAEIIIGAILVQNTNWRNVDRSLANLKAVTDFHGDRLLQLSTSQLQELIRPSGFYKNKARALQEVFTWLQGAEYDYHQIAMHEGAHLRSSLLKFHGIGEETADVLQLYVFDRPVFVADSYARKLFAQLGRPTKNYHQLKQLVSITNFTLAEAQEFHGLIDEFGKQYLKKETDRQTNFLAGTTILL